MFKKSTVLVLVLIVLLVIFRVFIVDSCSSKDVEYTEIESNNNAYVGDQSCKKCHTTEFNQWQQSHHYMSMLPPNDSTVKGDFNNVTFTADGVSSRFFKKGAKFFINTEGDDGKNHDFEVKYIFGFTPLQQYLIQFPGGRLQVPRLSWDVNKKKWFNQYAGQKIASHDWLHWTGNAQNWNTMCATCHSTNLKKNYDVATDTYKSSYSLINVSCESCHGAGMQHVDFINGDDYKSGEKVAGNFLKQTKKSTQTEQLNTCAPCHARVSELSGSHIASKEIMDNYIPQIPNTEFFHADGQVDDEDYIYTSFLQSKMFAKGLVCSTCHNPHSTKLKRIGNKTCTLCHIPTKYDVPSHTFHPKGSPSSECKNCHMPGKLYMGNDLRHDHSFRVPRPDLSVKYGTPNACSNCHKDKSEKTLADAIIKWYGPKRKYHFADDLVPGSRLDANSEKHLTNLIDNKFVPKIIKATATFYLGSIPTQTSLNTIMARLASKEAQIRYRALRSLASFPAESWRDAVGALLSDKVRAVRIAAADLYLGIPVEQIPSEYAKAFSSAKIELEKSLLYQTDFSVGNVMLADYYMKSQDYANAEKFYLRGLKKDANMNYALLNLSVVYNLQGKNKQALQALQSAMKNDPKNDRVYYNMALLHNETNNIPEAEKSFAKAMELKSMNPKVYYNYGLLLNQNKKTKQAETVLLKGITLIPSDPELYYALTFVYIQSNNRVKAQQAASKLKQLDPNNPNYQQIFSNLGI
ncbi:Tetratricopeptide repeat-containing protein [Flavobacterium fluvii]|uniref:Tetratricopeptide repeat-containing protein n=1 Tax=Flavobacterium fluvii TaxID=468056 RepID=A0A1M5M651_9FLAO|nr:tetratricopeptide repeat protein [Flavobacterium fluvii]SHG72746.1 Tetratricopeptide repeat-containing protein [Flavobacterium fluvii]